MLGEKKRGGKGGKQGGGDEWTPKRDYAKSGFSVKAGTARRKGLHSLIDQRDERSKSLGVLDVLRPCVYSSIV